MAGWDRVGVSRNGELTCYTEVFMDISHDVAQEKSP